VSAQSRKLPLCFDEQLYPALAERFTHLGRHKISVVRQGADDQTALKLADGILVTHDQDFDNPRRFPPGTHRGIIVLATSSDAISVLGKTLVRFLRSGHAAEAEGAIVVLHDRDFLVRTAGGTQTFRYE